MCAKPGDENRANFDVLQSLDGGLVTSYDAESR